MRPVRHKRQTDGQAEPIKPDPGKKYKQSTVNLTQLKGARPPAERNKMRPANHAPVDIRADARSKHEQRRADEIQKERHHRRETFTLMP
jgi:hypothetical protein